MDAGLADAFLRQSMHAGVRIDDGDPVYVSRVVRQVESGAEAYLEDVAVYRCEQVASELTDDPATQKQVAQTRKHDLGVETHEVPSTSPKRKQGSDALPR